MGSPAGKLCDVISPELYKTTQLLKLESVLFWYRNTVMPRKQKRRAGVVRVRGAPSKAKAGRYISRPLNINKDTWQSTLLSF